MCEFSCDLHQGIWRWKKRGSARDNMPVTQSRQASSDTLSSPVQMNRCHQAKGSIAGVRQCINGSPAQARQSARCLKRMCTRCWRGASEDAAAACPQGYEQTLHGTCTVRNTEYMDGPAHSTHSCISLQPALYPGTQLPYPMQHC